MMIKVFPHGKGEGNKPTRYLVREDYPGRDTRPPQVLRGDPAMASALIDSIDRRWKFTAGVLAWHPDDKVSAAQEEEVMDAFEQVAFAGLEPDQRYILWVRHTHAGHHELHFVIPRLELSSGKDFNAFPPGWQKDFGIFRDMFNWRENWARPDDPVRAREVMPKNTDLFKARLARGGKEVFESDRDKAKEEIQARLKGLADDGQIGNRQDLIEALKAMELTINRAGKDYISVKTPTGLKLRFKGAMFAENWKRKEKAELEETEDERKRKARNMVERLERDFERVIGKRTACNAKRYPVKRIELAENEKLKLPKKDIANVADTSRRKITESTEKTGRGLSEEGSGFDRANGQNREADGSGELGIEEIERYVLGSQSLVRELAGILAEAEKRRVNQAQPAMRRRMR